MKIRTSLSIVAGALLASAPVAFASPADSSSSQGSTSSSSDTQGSSFSGSQQEAGAQDMGVIQSVNSKKHALTLIVPQDVSTTYRRAGGITEISREMDMASISVPVAKDAQVRVDGQPASFGQLKMGDSVRVSFDPKQKKIVSVEATSLKSQGTSQNQNSNTQQPTEGQGTNPGQTGGSTTP